MPLYADAGYLRIGLGVMTGAVGAVGLTILLGHCGQLSLGHGFFLLLGATVYVVASSPSDSTKLGLGLPPLLGLMLALIASAAAGMAFAPVAGRLRGIYLGLASLGLIFIGLYLGQYLDAATGGTSTGRPVPSFEIFGFSFGSSGELIIAGVPFGRVERLWYLFLLFLVLSILAARRAVRGRPGRAWRAVRDGEASAAAMGIDPSRSKATAFAVSSAYAGLAGVMTVLSLTLLKPDETEYGTYGINATIAVLAMVIIGGLGSLWGAVVGAAIVAGLPLALSLSMPAGTGTAVQAGSFTPLLITQLLYGVALVLVMLVEPRGLAGMASRIRERMRVRAVTPTAASASAHPPGRSGRSNEDMNGETP
ncbi:branched-chain amino acid ABC transporter permease [Nonomuraea wenchangensis]|uniref:branched-chain amino acid ABC transporter permease n=1 Tax=Nonomuraea wenchangensis TaxID=568860 RepID=UPI003720DD0A